MAEYSDSNQCTALVLAEAAPVLTIAHIGGAAKRQFSIRARWHAMSRASGSDSDETTPETDEIISISQGDMSCELSNTGMAIWTAGAVLAAWTSRNDDLNSFARSASGIVELGCGCSAAWSIACAMLGARCVVATDGEMSTLRSAVVNARNNLSSRRILAETIETACLRWGDNDAIDTVCATLVAAATYATTRAGNGGEPGHDTPKHICAGNWLIGAADVVYYKKGHEALALTLTRIAAVHHLYYVYNRTPGASDLDGLDSFTKPRVKILTVNQDRGHKYETTFFEKFLACEKFSTQIPHNDNVLRVTVSPFTSIASAQTCSVALICDTGVVLYLPQRYILKFIVIPLMTV